ncbi:hypothetical protein MsAg5_03700 [Methanosarcinaceae archaeon Ag5]|uniref:Uncharacterized protein n=2 Tax=Methanolapillus africanus TaxID=3028297 RepID=A0AAE4SDF4_9EURY|nr:hypothetical protein [Methanosarcinaceae archaeon Ag5]
MQDHVNLSVEIDDLLQGGRQLSISGITRELKKRGINEHRLIVTGYLRAMNDLNRLNEFDLSPSKIYTLISSGSSLPEAQANVLESVNGSNESDICDVEETEGADFSEVQAGAEKETEPELKFFPKTGADIYGIIGAKLSHLTSSAVRFEMAVYLYTTLFERPCFESELIATGLDAGQMTRYFNGKEKDLLISKVKDKKYAEEFPEIAKGTTAYELHIEKVDTDILIRAINILNSILKDEVDVSGLAAKTSTKSIFDF